MIINEKVNTKSNQILNLRDYLITKYGATNIVIADQWEGDNLAIGFTDKSEKHLVYVAQKIGMENRFFVSLENPPINTELPYSPAGEFDNIDMNQVEFLLVKHLGLKS